VGLQKRCRILVEGEIVSLNYSVDKELGEIIRDENIVFG